MNTEVNQEPGKEEAPAGASSSAPHESNQSTASSVPSGGLPQQGVQGGLSARIQGLHDQHPQLQRLFEGTGKKSGKLLPGPAEYDRAYLVALLKYGVAAAGELAAAVMGRPDGHAGGLGVQYATGLVAEVQAAAAAAEQAKRAADADRFAEARSHTDFTVDEVRIIESDVTRYELHIEGKRLVLTAKQLCNQPEFRQSFLNLLQRVPTLPPSKGKHAYLWDDLVNSFLAEAQTETLAGNATDEAVQKRAVEKAKSAIPNGEQVERLHDDMAWVATNGRRYFTAEAIYDRVKQKEPTFKHRDLARILEGIGCEFDERFPAGDRTIEVWSELLPPPSSGGAQQCPSTGAEGSRERVEEKEVVP